MSWIDEHKNAGRVVVLILLLLAMMGPWAYSSDGVPPAAWCRDPFILLENGRWVKLVSGARILAFMDGAFLSMSIGLVSGATVLTGRAGEFLFVVGIILLVLPFFSTLLLIRGGDRRRLRVSHVMAWGLAAAQGLLLAVFGSGPHSELWGIWLYIRLAAAALTLELLTLLAGGTSG